MGQLATCLWFDDQAEDAANFYVDTFRGGKLGEVSRYSSASSGPSGKPAGSVMVVEFEIEGHRFQALNGGPIFTMSEAVSFVVERETQEEIDELWDALTSDGGMEQPCGWCKDRFGVSWQVIPAGMREIFPNDGSPAAERAWEALMQMKKIDIAALRRAAEGVPATSAP